MVWSLWSGHYGSITMVRPHLPVPCIPFTTAGTPLLATGTCPQQAPAGVWWPVSLRRWYPQIAFTPVSQYSGRQQTDVWLYRFSSGVKPIRYHGVTRFAPSLMRAHRTAAVCAARRISGVARVRRTPNYRVTFRRISPANDVRVPYARACAVRRCQRGGPSTSSGRSRRRYSNRKIH